MSPVLAELFNLLACSLQLSPLMLAALPPLSTQELHGDAQVVAVGVVGKVESREVKVAGGTDVEFTAELSDIKFEKVLVAPGAKTLELRFKRTGTRPPGWTGPSGQHAVFKKGDRVRIFGTQAPNGSITLLEPNGWEQAK